MRFPGSLSASLALAWPPWASLEPTGICRSGAPWDSLGLSVSLGLSGCGPDFFLIHGRAPTLQESADYCEVSLEKMQLYIDNIFDAGSLDSKVTHTDGDTTLMSLVSNEDDDLLARVETSVRLEAMDSLLERLKPDDRELVCRYYGVDEAAPMTLLALAKEKGLSRERVRQKIAKSMRRLRVHGLQHPLL